MLFDQSDLPEVRQSNQTGTKQSELKLHMHILFFILTTLGIYVVGAVLLYAWDALIGFGFELDGRDNAPIDLVAWTWPFSFWILMWFVISRGFKRLKDKRHAREERNKQIEHEKAVLRRKFCEGEKKS
jgi:TRAP-type C4-dicarboxylate transport system permease small subunit